MSRYAKALTENALLFIHYTDNYCHKLDRDTANAVQQELGRVGKLLYHLH